MAAVPLARAQGWSRPELPPGEDAGGGPGQRAKGRSAAQGPWGGPGNEQACSPILPRPLRRQRPKSSEAVPVPSAAHGGRGGHTRDWLSFESLAGTGTQASWPPPLTPHAEARAFQSGRRLSEWAKGKPQELRLWPHEDPIPKAVWGVLCLCCCFTEPLRKHEDFSIAQQTSLVVPPSGHTVGLGFLDPQLEPHDSLCPPGCKAEVTGVPSSLRPPPGPLSMWHSNWQYSSRAATMSPTPQRPGLDSQHEQETRFCYIKATETSG